MLEERGLVSVITLQFYQNQSGGVQWHKLMTASPIMVLQIKRQFFFTQKTFIKATATTGIND